MPIVDKNHYNPEEPKPLFIETKGFQYQIFKDSVRFLFGDNSLSVKDIELKQILENLNQYKESGYYTGQCISCHKFDALVKGYCEPCFSKEGMTYDA